MTGKEIDETFDALLEYTESLEERIYQLEQWIKNNSRDIGDAIARTAVYGSL